MIIKSDGIQDGLILDIYGKRSSRCNLFGIPNYSIPFSVTDAPKETVSFAILLEDKDAIPVCGFSWIHWVAANITTEDVKENASAGHPDFVQGCNSWYGKFGREGAFGYGGMTPPDAPHEYELHVFALDCELEIFDGFFYNEMYKLMQGHILEHSILKGIYTSR